MYTVEQLMKIKRSPELQDLEYARCVKDPYHWLTHWARTLDTHDEKNPIKQFPEKEYLKVLTQIWLENKLLLLPKSRQMMISWILCALYLWDTQFFPAKLTFFQSKREEDADDLVKRAKFIYDHEPDFLKRYHDGTKWIPVKANPHVPEGRHLTCRLSFPAIYSEIRGIPQGGDIIRMQTCSGIFADEMGFQPEAEAAYTAAKPTISAKGRFTGVSTAEDNSFFEDLVFDRGEEA
jgi:hypothetical protein